MFRSIKLITAAAGLLLGTASLAQAPSGAPAGSTGQCKDGSYWTGATKQGACRGHHGVQSWYGAAGPSGSAAAPAAAAAAPAASAPAPAAAAAPVAAAAPAASTKSSSGTKSSGPSATAAPGGGPGLVWVNSSSKVYHCPTDRWYGKTKSGEYMSESDAIAKGNHADHGKACGK